MKPLMNYLIVVFDAGPGEVLCAWVKNHPENNYRFCVEGPAKKLFQRRLQVHQFCELSSPSFQGIDRVLTGMSWGSDLERKAWQQAQSHSIPSIGYLTGYANVSSVESPFLYRGQKIIPDFLWLINEGQIPELESLGLPREKISIVPDLALLEILKRIEREEVLLSKEAKHTDHVLYVAENITTFEAILSEIIRPRGYTEFEAFELFLRKVKEGHFGEVRRLQIRLRPHPSENGEKYRFLIDQYPELRVEISPIENSLERDLAWASHVVGCESNALMYAAESHRKVTSCIPTSAKVFCRIPHSKIEKIVG